MFDIRRAEKRGQGAHGWLHSRHSFSFADYYDPQRMGFSVLRVINDDEVAPGAGFPTHAHRDMEIISVILAGVIEHKDSMGHVQQLRAGDVQRMSAGTGVTHSEYNASDTDMLRFLQIWIEPNQKGIVPDYEQRTITTSSDTQNLTLLVSPDGRKGSMCIHQDALLYSGQLKADESVDYAPAVTRKAYLHVVTGQLAVNGKTLSPGDAVAVENEAQLVLQNPGSTSANHFLLFDLP